MMSGNQEEEVKERFHDNIKAVSGCLNFDELIPVLIEESVFSLEDGLSFDDTSLSRSKKMDILVQKLETGLFSKFLGCLQREKNHLGHAYITALLEGKQYALESEIAHSEAIKDAVRRKFTHFTNSLNLSALISHLHQSKLLTEAEMELLYASQKSRSAQVRMFGLLSLCQLPSK